MLKIQVSATCKKDEDSVIALINAIGSALDNDYCVEIKQKGFNIDRYYNGDDTYFELECKTVIIEKSKLNKKTDAAKKKKERELAKAKKLLQLEAIAQELA